MVLFFGYQQVVKWCKLYMLWPVISDWSPQSKHCFYEPNLNLETKFTGRLGSHGCLSLTPLQTFVNNTWTETPLNVFCFYISIKYRTVDALINSYGCNLSICVYWPFNNKSSQFICMSYVICWCERNLLFIGKWPLHISVNHILAQVTELVNGLYMCYFGGSTRRL